MHLIPLINIDVIAFVGTATGNILLMVCIHFGILSIGHSTPVRKE